jgi:hypothetical protein
VERDKPTKSESVGQTLPQLPWKRGILKFLKFLSSDFKLSHNMVDILTMCHEVWWKESKHFLNPVFFVSMATAAKIYPTDSDCFGLSRSTRCGCCSYQVSSISVRSNFAVVAMETKKTGFKKCLDSFHQTSWHIVRISTILCDSFWDVEQIQNGGHVVPIKFHQFLFVPTMFHEVWWKKLKKN